MDDLVGVADADAEPTDEQVQVPPAEESPVPDVGRQGAQETLIISRSAEDEVLAVPEHPGHESEDSQVHLPGAGAPLDLVSESFDHGQDGGLRAIEEELLIHQLLSHHHELLDLDSQLLQRRLRVMLELASSLALPELHLELDGEVVGDLDLQVRQQAALAFMLGHEFEEGESQHAGDAAVLELFRLISQDLADAVEMTGNRALLHGERLAELIHQLSAAFDVDFHMHPHTEILGLERLQLYRVLDEHFED